MPASNPVVCQVCGHSDATVSIMFRPRSAHCCPSCGCWFFPSGSSQPEYEDDYYAPQTAARFPKPVEFIIRWFRILRAFRIFRLLKKSTKQPCLPLTRFSHSTQIKMDPGDPLHQFQVLDIGCGRGLLIKFLGRFGIGALGTQVSRNACEAARKQGQHVAFGDFRQIDLPGPFRLISLIHVLEHLDNLPHAIARLHELLQTGGILLIEVPSQSGLGARSAGVLWLGHDPEHHRHSFFPDALISSLEKQGFSLFHRDEISFEHGPFHLGQSLANALFPSQANAFFDILRGVRKDRSGLVFAVLQAPILIFSLLLYPLLAPLIQHFRCGDAVTLWFRKLPITSEKRP